MHRYGCVALQQLHVKRGQVTVDVLSQVGCGAPKFSPFVGSFMFGHVLKFGRIRSTDFGVIV